MSGDRMSADQVAALVEAAKHGQLPEQPAAGPVAAAPRLRTVDFSRPTKFTSDHQRRIERAIETFCQTSVTRLSTELRTPVELETLNTTQATWSGAQAQLPAGSLWVTLDVQPLGTRMLFTHRAVLHPDVPGLPARRHARQAPARAALLGDRHDAHPAPGRVDGPPAVARLARPGRDQPFDRRDRDLQRREPDRGRVRAHPGRDDREPDQQALGVDGAADSLARHRFGRRPAVGQGEPRGRGGPGRRGGDRPGRGRASR